MSNAIETKEMISILHNLVGEHVLLQAGGVNQFIGFEAGTLENVVNSVAILRGTDPNTRKERTSYVPVSEITRIRVGDGAR